MLRVSISSRRGRGGKVRESALERRDSFPCLGYGSLPGGRRLSPPGGGVVFLPSPTHGGLLLFPGGESLRTIPKSTSSGSGT